MLNALEELNIDVKSLKKDISPNLRKSFLKFELESFHLDLLPYLNHPIRFIDAYKRRQTVTIEDVEINIISKDDLIENKISLSRPKDLIDIKMLKEKNKK